MTLEPLKILLVEDNATDARLVQEMLQEVRGTFELTHVTRLEAAAHQTKKRSNVILFASSLSSTQDLEAVKQLRNIYPQVPIVVMSELDCEAIALEAVIGVQDYLIKGQTNAHSLVRTLQYAIERQRWCWEIRQAKQALQQQMERYRLLAGITLRIRQYEEKWLSLSRVASRKQERNVMLAVNSPTDIIVPDLAEVALQDVARFHLSEATFEGIMVHERGFVLDANQTLATMFRCEVSELIGENVFESLATPEFQEVVRKNILSGCEKQYEVVGLRKDGSTFPIEIQGKVIPYQGRLVWVVAIRDITERKQRESIPWMSPPGAALTSSKLILYREIIANSNDAIAIIDQQGHFIEQNAAHRLLLGYSDEDLLGQTPALFDCEPAFSVIFEEIQRCGSYRGEVTIHSKSGALVNIELSAFAVRDDPSQPGYYVGIARDITERKQAEIELRDSKEAAEAGSRAKSEFLTTMSHELRTPLNTILGLSHVLDLEMFGALNAKQKEYITCIHSSGKHLLELINDILDLSKVEAGKEELICVPLQVCELSDYCLKIVRLRAFEKGINLTCQIDPEADVCIGDQRRVKQMLLNLLINAIKFTSSGSVSLRVQKVSQGITFTVADTGIGIASEQLKLLFQPFKQLDSRLSRQYEGTGLGLALTRKLARLHGGDVTVQSTLGEGSQFTLLLPVGVGVLKTET